MKDGKRSWGAEQIAERLATDVLRAARAGLKAAHLGLLGDFTIDKGLLQQVAQVSKLENNPWCTEQLD